MPDMGVMMKRSVLVLAGLLCSASVQAEETPGIPATHILDLNDGDSLITLKAMALAGDNHSKLLAEAWIVMSSIATGEGRQRCGFDDDVTKAMWQPALDGMSKDEIYELNRVVTSNFRNAQNGSSLDKRKLFPVSRQAVTLLSDDKGSWSCFAITEVRERASTYVRTTRSK